MSLEQSVESFIRINKNNILVRDEPQRIQLIADKFQIDIEEAEELYEKYKAILSSPD